MLILTLCTGNICRSPMAEVLLTAAAGPRGAAPTVASAGFVTEGQPAEPHAVRVMADRGLDLSGHRSRRLTAEMVAEADLLLGMTAEHVREVVALDRTAFGRSFTLRELHQRGEALGPVVGGDVEAWLDAVGEGREPMDLLRAGEGYDIADPMGRSLRRFRAAAEAIEEAVDGVAALLWPPEA